MHHSHPTGVNTNHSTFCIRWLTLTFSKSLVSVSCTPFGMEMGAFPIRDSFPNSVPLGGAWHRVCTNTLLAAVLCVNCRKHLLPANWLCEQDSICPCLTAQAADPGFCQPDESPESWVSHKMIPPASHFLGQTCVCKLSMVCWCS